MSKPEVHNEAYLEALRRDWVSAYYFDADADLLGLIESHELLRAERNELLGLLRECRAGMSVLADSERINSAASSALRVQIARIDAALARHGRERPAVNPDAPMPGDVVQVQLSLDQAPPYVIANLAEMGIDPRTYRPKWETVEIIHVGKKYAVMVRPGCDVEYLAPVRCVEFRRVE